MPQPRWTLGRRAVRATFVSKSAIQNGTPLSLDGDDHCTNLVLTCDSTILGRARRKIGLRIDQDAGVQDRVGIEGALRCPERPREALRPLPVVPCAMVAADRMMVCDRSAKRD
jgi:hypothetical protein